MNRIYLFAASCNLLRFCAQLSVLMLMMTTAGAETQENNTFQDWILRCEKTEDEDLETCFITQNLVLRETGQRLLTVLVGASNASTRQAAVTVELPLGISLPPGINVQIDKGKAHHFDVERCVQSACLVPFSLTPELLRSMKAGQQAKITFSDSNRRLITVPVSLKGFTAAFNALR